MVIPPLLASLFCAVYSRLPSEEATIGVEQPMMPCSTVMTHHSQSLSVIARCEGKDNMIVSQWKLSNGILELPTPEPGANYFLEVCISDENRVRIPVEIAACVPEVLRSPSEVRSPAEQS